MAADIDDKKVVMYNAAATEAGDPDAVLVDICDASFFRRSMPEALRVDLLVCSIPCQSFSDLGKREGMAAVADFVAGLLRFLKHCGARMVLLECVKGRLDDALFNEQIAAPLAKLGFDMKWGLLEEERVEGEVRARA